MQNFTPKYQVKFTTEEFDSETVVYDDRGAQIHILKGPASDVYRLCTGDYSRDQIFEKLRETLESEEQLDSILQSLTDKGLLVASDSSTGSSRRDFLKTAAMATGALIFTIPVPVAAATLSTCFCDTTNTAGTQSSTNGCIGRTPADDCTVIAGVQTEGDRCGTVSCFRPSDGACVCESDDNRCATIHSGTVTQKCCQGNNPTSAGCANTML